MIKHSTRNNSLSEEMLLCEDITLFGDSEAAKPTLEYVTEKEPKFECDLWKHKFEQENELKIHMKSHEINYPCVQCSHQAPNEMELASHIAHEHPAPINCADCTFTALSAKDMENHVDVLHKMKELFSCSQCDFDSEDSNELKAHNDRDIHDIRTQNQTFKEAPVFKCHLCEYKTNEVDGLVTHKESQHRREVVSEEKQVKYKCDYCEFVSDDRNISEDHATQSHGVINCDKCEYSALDKSILKKHMYNHTGSILFTCRICEFESTKQGML